jgi:hypothetical protein
MKILKVISALALISLIAVTAVACTKDNNPQDNNKDNDSQLEKPIEDADSVHDDNESEELETPVIIETDETEDTAGRNETIKDEDDTLVETDPKKIIEEISGQVINAISNKDAATISKYVHPVKGIRFTPYTFVSLESDIVFSKEEMISFFEDSDEYLWGYYDGIGDEITLTPSQYYDKFIYSEDFVNAPQAGYNEVLSFGNALENQFEVYEEPIVVEYYFPGFYEEYEGMDWKSLRLVFEQYEDSWKLVGIIHNQWTI